MRYLFAHPLDAAALALQHLQIAGGAVLLAAAIALPLAALSARSPGLRTALLGLFGMLYAIPSLALMVLLVPWLGLSPQAVVVAIAAYVQLVLFRHFLAALDSVPPALLEAAVGSGMTAWQRWWQVQVPLGLPVGLAGVRLAAIVAVAIATIGAKFGAGGLGTLLFEGIAESRIDKLNAGAIAVALLAWGANGALRFLERRVGAEGRQARAAR